MKRNRLFKATFALVVPAAMVLTSISAAQNLTEAIGMVNASQRNIHDAAYIEAVRSIQTHGTSCTRRSEQFSITRGPGSVSRTWSSSPQHRLRGS